MITVTLTSKLTLIIATKPKKPMQHCNYHRRHRKTIIRQIKNKMMANQEIMQNQKQIARQSTLICLHQKYKSYHVFTNRSLLQHLFLFFLCFFVTFL